MKHRSLNYSLNHSLIRVLIISVLSLILAACGGGSGGGGGNILTGTGGAAGTTGDPTLSLALLDEAGATTTTVNGSEQGTVQATLLDAEGNPIAGAVISFSAGVGLLAGNQSALTDANGVAEIIITAGTVAGAGQISASATVDSVTVSSDPVGISSDGNGPVDDPATFITSLTLVPDTISRGDPGTATLTLTDNSGASISGAVVEFGVTRGVMDPVSGAVFTDANGVATVLVKAGTVEDSGVLSASVTISNDLVEATPVNFITLGDGIDTLTLSVSTGAGGGTSLAADDMISSASPATITATVIDSAGDPVEGTIVAFSLPEGVGTLGSEQDITNAAGVASVLLTAGTTAGFGTVTATTTVNGQPVVSEPGTEIVFETAGDESVTGEGSTSLAIVLSILDGAASPIDPPNLDADTPAILSALVTDSNGDPVQNVIVRFAAELGDLFPTSGLALTDSLGIASVSLNAGSVPGAGTASASIIIDGQSFDSDSLAFSTLGNAGDTEVVLTLAFADATPGNESSIITLSDPGTVNITVEDAGGAALPNRKATITTSLGSLVAGTSSGASVIATSDASGKISAQVLAGATIGNGDIVVTVGDTTSAIQFDVGVDGLQIGTFAGPTFTAGTLAIATSPLSAGGTTTASVTVVDQSETVIPGIEIQFSSNCSLLEAPLALVTQSVTTDSSGVATATYQADGCVGNDLVRAIETSSGESATGTIDVLQSVTGSIRFDSVVVDPDDPTLTSIQIKESGGIATAAIIFQVLDVLGDPVSDKEASFELTTNIGGLALVTDTGLTASDGKVTATVTAGFIPTTVRVRASVEVDTDNDGIDDTTLVTLSGLLTVNTGIPDQNSMSVSTGTFNLEGNNLDGLTTVITVRMSDFFNNPVPDGTAVSFTTELGSVSPECTTLGGACTTTFTTQEPRAPLDPAAPFRQLSVDSCPAQRINDEPVTVIGTAGNTAYMVDVDDTVVVQTSADAYLTEGTANDYTLDTDGTGITCISAGCLLPGNWPLKITYSRLWLDEDFDDIDDGDVLHDITNPGVATGPFVARSGKPCRAASRAATAAAGAYSGGLGQPYGGRSTVLVRAQGEESFIDTNGNGQYDYNEPFVDLTEAFLDKNEDLVYGNGTPGVDDSRDQATAECYGPVAPVTDPSAPTDKCFQEGGDEETFLDFDVSGTFDAGNHIYNGSMCPKAISDRTVICASAPCDEATERYCTRDPVDIRRSMVLLMSGSGANMSVRDALNGEFISAVNLNVTYGAYTASVSVLPNLPFPAGTPMAPGTEFTIGDAASATEAPPRTGETVSLTTGTSTVAVDIADLYNGVLPAGSSISYNSGEGGCEIQNTPNSVVPNTSSLGFTRVFIALGPPAAVSLVKSAPVTVTVTTPDGNVQSAISFTCTSP